MTDIVERLRKQKWQVLDEMRGLIEDTTAYEAADEIERLREVISNMALLSANLQGIGETALGEKE